MPNTAKKTLFVSDFDDTLAQTDANVYVTNKGTRTKLSPAEFAVYTAQHGDEFDFSEFDKLINPRPIERFVRLLKLAQSGKADKVVVLTARGHTLPVVQFLRTQGITSGVSIAALGDANPQKKADYIQKNIDKDGYTRVAFIDDSPKNVDAVKKLRDKNPNVRILVHRAKEHPTPNQPTSTENRLYLDDLRDTPSGFNLRAYTAKEAIDMLEKNNISYISFDHDLGEPEAGTGYEVAKWIEEKAYSDPTFNFPDWKIHSANPVGAKNIEMAMKSAERGSQRTKVKQDKPNQQTPSDKKTSLKQLLQTKIRNPKTNNDILIKTALAYDKNHPVHIQAIKTISAHTKQNNIRLKKNQ